MRKQNMLQQVARPEDQHWNDSKQRCWDLLATWCGGDHNMQPVLHWGAGLAMRWRGDVATHDSDMLTWLVILAHQHCCRVSISQHGLGYIRIQVWARKPEGTWVERHPDLSDLIARCTRVKMTKREKCQDAL